MLLFGVLFATLSMTAPVAASVGVGGRTSYAPESGSRALSNWAGYIATGSAGEFTAASADWVVPAVTCLAKQDLYAPWVGIDGYGDTTVEQTGVETTCASGSPVEKPWYEMYPARPKFFRDPVSTGDAISASVSYSATTNKFTISITDVTQGWTKTVTKSLKSAQRLSAEVVIESPASVRNYPSISAVNFTNVLFNGNDLATFDPVTSDSGQPVVYAPGPITDGTDFTIAPKG